MIELITGLPGNCKTLYTIAFVKAWAEKDNRPVFYSGIPELKLDWTLIEPEKWMECPPGSIVVIDECQRVFRNRSLGAIPGKHVTDLETHRHLGIDLVFITQHPSLIDPAIRRLAGRHKHMIRIWGFEASTVHQWDAVRDNCDKPAGRKDSEQSKWKFDKSVYGLYKSAEVHTVKSRIPMRVKLLVLIPFALAGAGYAVYWFTVGKHSKPGPQVTVQAPGAVPGAPGATPGQAVQARFDPMADARDYAWKNTPRVPELVHTAPKYDRLTEPTAVPVPSMCIASGQRCQCYSQQGTRMALPVNMCLDVVYNGAFQEFNPNGQERGASDERVSKSTQVLDAVGRLPLSGSSTREAGHGALVPGTASALPPGEGFRPASGVRSPGAMAS